MTAWRAILKAAQPATRHFHQALAQPGDAQRALLGAILQANAGTCFGRACDFASIRSFEDYRARLPIRSYADHAPDIARMAQGESHVLTGDSIIAFEETGGSTGAKRIPYTARSLTGFRDAVLPWLADLAQRRPAVMRGQVYAAISPATRPARATSSGIPIGLESDAAYLGEALAPAFLELLAVSPDLGRIEQVDRWRLATLTQLVANPRLSLISVWSPSFLTELVAHIAPLSDAIAANLPAEARLRLEAALASGALDTRRLWPMLDTISCWTDGASAHFIPALRGQFPEIWIDAKGLLATEAAITTPLGSDQGAVPALLSCFTEFIDTHGASHLCDTLQPGEAYRLALTTWGGLYRYDIGDIVRCVGVSQGVPRLMFEGRGGVTSDMVGEKLDDAFVVSALAGLGLPCALVPHLSPRPHYEVWIDAPEAGLNGQKAEIVDKIEAKLSANPQYAYARKMNQLGSVAVSFRPGFHGRMADTKLASGGRLGDIKAIGLLTAAPLGRQNP